MTGAGGANVGAIGESVTPAIPRFDASSAGDRKLTQVCCQAARPSRRALSTCNRLPSRIRRTSLQVRLRKMTSDPYLR